MKIRKKFFFFFVYLRMGPVYVERHKWCSQHNSFHWSLGLVDFINARLDVLMRGTHFLFVLESCSIQRGSLTSSAAKTKMISAVLFCLYTDTDNKFLTAGYERKRKRNKSLWQEEKTQSVWDVWKKERKKDSLIEKERQRKKLRGKERKKERKKKKERNVCTTCDG